MSAPTSPPADWRALPLVPAGRSLIEASAGAGKTWTIAALYLRLVLERMLSPRQIVVTTFTDAAAQELRERVRGKLEWALRLAAADAAPATAETGQDSAAAWLCARWTDAAPQRALDLARLKLALAGMDVAPISTLHTLCSRVLAEHPFACGVGFTPGELVASDLLLGEVSEDLWRRLQQGDGSDELQRLQQAAGEKLNLQQLRERLGACLAPGVHIGVSPPVDLGQVLPLDWAARLRALVARDACLDKRSVLRRTWLALAQFIEDRAVFPDQGSIKTLREAGALKGILKGAREDAEVKAAVAFSVEVAPVLEVLHEQSRLRFWHALTVLAREQLHSRLRVRHQSTFDDLLTTVSAALAREAATDARPLADALFAAWPVALVDEFQDTDGLQYGILDAIYRDADGAVRGRLVMIGDPKQAIYRFRGSDIHAYRRAADQADADGRLRLDTNHRSSRLLVAAVNRFFDVAGRVLSSDDGHRIRYEEVASSGRRDAEPYTVDGKVCTQPLQIHYLAQVADASPVRRALALDVCANQIAALLASPAQRIGARRVQPTDIAVLLPARRDIVDLRDRLVLRGVPCVTSTRDSVFQSDVARELQVVLYAVSHQGDLPALRAAAATRLWGDSFSQMRQRADDVAGWQPVAEVFRRWQVAWRECGLQAVVDGLLGHLAPRYLQTPGGERVLTDLRHLGELLQAQSERTPGAEELLAWFTACRDADGGAEGEVADAAQLRIESDQARLRLMTLHASKGLEFPIVFLPLMWDQGERNGSGLHVVSDPRSGQRNIGFSAAAKAQELQDLQDERFRLLYVALTRAMHACHVYALAPDRPKHGGARDAATGTARSALDVMLARLQPALRAADGSFAALRAATPNIAWIEGWQPLERHDYAAAVGDDAPRHARALPPMPSGPVPARHSFTTLAHAAQRSALDPEASAGDEAEATPAEPATLPDTDVEAAAPSPSPPHPALVALAAVRGVDIGNAIHAIFEHRAIGVPLAGQRDLVEHWLDAAGVRRQGYPRAALVEALVARLQAALEAPLGLEGDPELRLADLPAHAMRAEMEFTFMLDEVSMAAVQHVCARHGEADLVPPGTQTLSGLMNGKIDLVFQHDGRFHVLDYKGNYLGDGVDNYRGDALRASMDANRYRFQALIYSVAADRYLRQRLGAAYRRAEHLGECVYLFVRAAGLVPGAGIWRARFADALLTAVDEALGAHGHTEGEA